MLNLLKNKNILLVEDELDIQKYFKETFEFFFNRVYCASNGEEALDIYYEKTIDVIFTDYSMPIMDGYELILEIRRLNKIIPIIVFSNHDDKEKLQKCITLGLSGYIFKPLNYNDVKRFLENFSKELLDKHNIEFFISQNCYINIASNILTVDNKKYILTELEVAFLSLMISHPNMVVKYELIHNVLYKFDTNTTSLKNLVYRLKSKYKFDKIKNIINVGYLLVVNEK